MPKGNTDREELLSVSPKFSRLIAFLLVFGVDQKARWALRHLLSQRDHLIDFLAKGLITKLLLLCSILFSLRQNHKTYPVKLTQIHKNKPFKKMKHLHLTLTHSVASSKFTGASRIEIVYSGYNATWMYGCDTSSACSTICHLLLLG